NSDEQFDDYGYMRF
uniref:Sulfakinin-2 n=1 Tax=Rhodnius prolixus TaxID=13249 RepID=SK2_RHOPR|nr:RecName: Full=Sulfakinin-2; Short=Rhopr-SK-2 [Rhodnius prolixus]